MDDLTETNPDQRGKIPPRYGSDSQQPQADEGTVTASHLPTPGSAASFGHDLSGSTVAGYRLVRKIAEGGMGIVYEAIQTKLDRRVALKVLTDELSSRPEFLKRFEREAKAAAALNHPNVVQVHDFGESDGLHYIIMEYVEGDDVSQYVQKIGKLDIPTALSIVEQAAHALKAAREKSIIHRDIKPSNLLITSDGRIKVSDLGLAKILNEKTEVTATGVGMGSPYFIAPEQADDSRNVDHRVDIYALGITLLFLLTGKKPFDGTSPYSIVFAHVHKPLPTGKELGTELPSEVESFIRRMAAKDPKDRYQDYDSLLTDLQKVKAGASPTRAPIRLEKTLRSRQIVVAGVALFGILVFAITFLILSSRHKAAIAAQKANQVAQNPRSEFPNRDGFPGEGRERGFGPGPGPDRGERGFRRGEPPRFQDGEQPHGRFPLPMGHMNRPEGVQIEPGSFENMLEQVKKFAADNPDKYTMIVDAYRSLGEQASTQQEQRQAQELQNQWGSRHMRLARQAVDKYEAKMKEVLKTGTALDAYNVWKDFPSNMRNWEIDNQIGQILEQNLPADFIAPEP